MRRGADRIQRLLISALIGLAIILGAATSASAQDAVVRFYLFYGEACPHCHEVMDNYLPAVYKKYGDQVEYKYIEVWTDSDAYLTLLALEAKLGVPEQQRGAVPALVIGDKVLIGSAEIPAKLETYIDEYLAQGGVDFPSLDNLPEIVLPTPQPTVQILLFFDPNRADFEDLNTFVVGLGQRYGSQLQAYGADATVPENAAILEQVHTALGVEAPPPGTPEVLIDRRVLVGMEEIESRLPGLLDEYLAQGGSTLTLIEELIAGQPTPTATEETPASATVEPEATVTPELAVTMPAPKPIYLAYFEQAGCQECARTIYDLRYVQDQYPQLVVESFSMEEGNNKALNEWLSEKYGVPEKKRLSTPMIFVGEDVLIGTEATLNNLMAAVGKYVASGAARTWDEYDPAAAEKSLIDRFESFGLITVLGAGLIDGLNPCAFATLVFLVSYLTLTGRRGRDILFVGLAFALGVFLTYLLVGVGLLKIIQSLSFFTALGRWVYLLTALLCVVLSILSFRDFFTARSGQGSEMTLKLPLGLRRRINKVIRENTQSRAFVAMAFVSGFAVSLIELACTGQVYLPTIVYVLSQPDLAAQAFLYLALYCLMFIVPLIVVFVLSYFGTTSEQLVQFTNQHTSTIKLITALVFVILALWMTWTLLPLFGITSPWNWVVMAGELVVIGVGVAFLQLTRKPAPKKGSPRRRRSRV